MRRKRSDPGSVSATLIRAANGTRDLVQEAAKTRKALEACKQKKLL